MALDSSERDNLEDRAETRGVPVQPNDVADCTGRVDCGGPPADLAEEVATDFVPDRVIFAAQGRLIRISGSVDLDLLFVGGVAESENGTLEGRRRVKEAS